MLRVAAAVEFARSVILLGNSIYEQLNGGRATFGPALGGMVIAGICYGWAAGATDPTIHQAPADHGRTAACGP